MRCLLAAVFLMGLTSAHAQSTGFAVTTAGDTIWLNSSAWIAVDRHPQLLVYKDASGRKHKRPASDFTVVNVPSAARAFARPAGAAFDARPIPTRGGSACWHFVQELFRQDSVRFYRSVHCYRCQRMSLYVQRGERGRMELLGHHNWKTVVEQYLPQREEVAKVAAKRNYDVVRVERLLWRLRE